MVLSLIPALVGIVFTVALAVASILSGALTAAAGGVAAAFGVFIVVLGGFPYLILLVLFVLASTLATRYGFEEKRLRRVQEGTRGERGVSNVVAHAVLPAVVVAAGAAFPTSLPPASVALVYTALLAFGASDTFASEFGVLAGRARSILTGRPVPPGTNGGVSGIGELFALVGALGMSVVATALFVVFGPSVASAPVLVAAGSTAGFLACQVDSVLGETLENRGWLTKGSTNFLAMVSSLAVAVVILYALGGTP